MYNSKKYRIGIFEDRISLYAYIDDKLIFYGNHTESGTINFIYDKTLEKVELKNFLSANNYTIKRELAYQHEVRLQNFNCRNNFHHLFFINTAYNKDGISRIIDASVEKYDNSEKVVFIYLFNSDSNFDYYVQNKSYRQSTIVSSPSGPIKIKNPFSKPF